MFRRIGSRPILLRLQKPELKTSLQPDTSRHFLSMARQADLSREIAAMFGMRWNRITQRRCYRRTIMSITDFNRTQRFLVMDIHGWSLPAMAAARLKKTSRKTNTFMDSLSSAFSKAAK